MSSASPGAVREASSAPVAGSSAANSAGRQTYTRILKSSALIGGSSLVTLGVSIARAKTTAVLLGPAGVGLMGLYWAVLDLAQNLAGAGLNNSGVRQIADADASGDAERIARTAAVLNRTLVCLGIIGALALAGSSRFISIWTFGDADHQWWLAALSVAVLLRLVSDGQGATIQGMRRIGDVARKNVLSAVVASAASILLVYALGERGIVPALVATMGVTLLVSWWYRRKIVLPPAPALGIWQFRQEAWPLLSLGLVFMASAVLTAGAAYAIRVIVREHHGVAAAGLYQSAWAIGGIYVAFILQAMGSDFYPRLTSAAHDRDLCNRLVNEQTFIGMVLAGPGVIATVALAPLIIAVLYDSAFSDAVRPLRWICMGMALRVVAWPMGYIILAKAARVTCLVTEIAATIVHVGLAYLLVPRFGVVGASMAFAGLYAWHSVVVYLVVRRMTGFAWSSDNIRAAGGISVLSGVAFWVCDTASPTAGVLFGSVLAVGSGLYSIRQLTNVVPLERVPPSVQTVLRRCHLMAASA
jgi:antigen flippase